MLKLLRVCLLFTFCIAACKPSPHHSNHNSKKVLNWYIPDDIPTFDPATAAHLLSIYLTTLVTESLYQYSYQKFPPKTKTILKPLLEPLLADGMPKISANQLHYEIKIKKGVFFQDDPSFPEGKGRELKAQDFIYAWKRLFHPKVLGARRFFFEGRIVGLDQYHDKLMNLSGEPLEKAFSEPIEGLKALDDYTLSISLTSKYPQLPKMLSLMSIAPVPHEAIAKYGHDGLTTHIIGTGPYLLKSYLKGSKIIFAKNPKFRKETIPLLDEIHAHIIKQTEPAWLHFLKGELDIMGLPKDEFEKSIVGNELSPELQAKGITFHLVQELQSSVLAINMKSPLLGSNLHLRKAIAYAIDRDQWNKIFLNGKAVKAAGVIPDGIEGKTKRTQFIFDYDPKKAKEELALAGFPNGKGLRPLKYDSSGTETSNRQLIEFLGRSLKEIGIQIEASMNTMPAYNSKLMDGTMELFSLGYTATYPDAENFLRFFYGKYIAPGPNLIYWKNSDFDSLYEQIVAQTPSRQRTKLISRAEDIILEQLPVIPLFYPVSTILQQRRIKNYYPENNLVINFLKYIDVE